MYCCVVLVYFQSMCISTFLYVLATIVFPSMCAIYQNYYFRMQIICRNIKPRICCICPFHHDWDAERVAYRNAVKIEIARKALCFKPNPTYESLVRCLTRKA